MVFQSFGCKLIDIAMTARLLLSLQTFLCYLTATSATVYHYNETSEVTHFQDIILSGFRDDHNKDFILGGLFPVRDCTRSSLPLTVVGSEWLEAMLFSIDQINNDDALLPSMEIGYDVRDTCNNEIFGFNEALDIYLKAGNSSVPLLGIVGPASNHVTLPIANLFDLFQIPMVSYASSSATLSNKNLFEYFLRTIPSSNLQAHAMADLISHFGWDYVNVIFTDDYEYGDPGSDTFIDSAMQHKICVDVKAGITPLEQSNDYDKFNRSVVTAVSKLLSSQASVVVVFADAYTVWTLFNELNKTKSVQKFTWIASDRWADSGGIPLDFPNIANGTFGFRLNTKYVGEFAHYFSQLTPDANIRDPFFSNYYTAYCNPNGTHCPYGLINHPYYSQGNHVPLIIDAVYVFAHAIQNFLDDNCDSPLRWNRTAQHCDGMKLSLTGENLLGYLHNVTFSGIQDRTVSFDDDGDPPGVYEIIRLQTNDSGQYEYVSLGFWNSAYAENALTLNNTDGIEKIDSTCSDPCNEGYIRSITNQNCPSCFECIPCVGPTYSMNSSGTNCSLCSDNHWGNNPLSGSTHCVPVEVRHLDFSNGWSITSMCIASITLIILAVITVIFVMTWNTPVVKSSGREEMIMLLIGIGACCVLTYIVVAPPSTGVCVFQRIGVWLCFSLAFGALLIKIIRVARIFHSIKSSAKRPRFTDPKHQVIFTIAIVAGQLILVAIGLGVDPPAVERDPEVVLTSSGQQTGEAPEIIETCQQPHTAILVLLLAYNFLIIVGCTILGLMTMGFPDNFNEAKHVMFTSFTLMVIWVLFMPLYFYTDDEFQSGVLALGIVLSAVALMAGVFFPRVFIIMFQKHKNSMEYVSQQNHTRGTGSTHVGNYLVGFQRSKAFVM